LQILEDTGILVFTSICTSIADTGRFWYDTGITSIVYNTGNTSIAAYTYNTTRREVHKRVCIVIFYTQSHVWLQNYQTEEETDNMKQPAAILVLPVLYTILVIPVSYQNLPVSAILVMDFSSCGVISVGSIVPI
jgi:hypothetical protein